jgi:hypothetical protein
MDPLGDMEEVRIAVDHEPASVDPGAPGVGDQRQQHLGHTAAARG